MGASIYQINKGVSRPIEFKGLKGVYIGVLAVGLVFLLVGFAVLYILRVPLFVLLPVIVFGGGAVYGGVSFIQALWGARAG